MVSFLLFIPILTFAKLTSAICDSGSLVIEEDTRTGRFSATIYNQDAVKYFVEQSYEFGPGTCVGECQGLVQLVEKKFSKNTTVSYSSDGAILKIKGLVTKSNGRHFHSLSAFKNGPKIKSTGDGYKVILSGETLTENLENFYYHIGDWFFPNCSFRY